MQHIEILTKALEYIDENLAKPIKTEEVARVCYCSKTALEKIFRCINNISVHDYITRRRMTCAGRMLLRERDKRILDVALEFGFSGNESFTRAFYQVWNCTPSEFRKNTSFTELFPRYLGYASVEKGERKLAESKNVDISELYDLFSSRKGCYFVCVDIKNMIKFNEISRKAGDLAILEALRRMKEAAGDEDYIFRIGGDEFVMLTNSKDESYANSVAEEIERQNGECFSYEDDKLPLELHISSMQMEDKTVRYHELFNELHVAIEQHKK